MTLLSCFPPIADLNSKILILGSMPGEASLQAAQYYAHPRNLFWPLLCALFVTADETPFLQRSYAERESFLLERRIAVWDVVKNCQRDGSLDTAIRNEIANDFSEFLTARPDIRHVFFNGTKAEKSFQRFVIPTLPAPLLQELKLVRLPSTSPANAGASFEKKLAAWSAVKEALSS